MALLYLQNRDTRVIKSGSYVKYAGASISGCLYALLGEANIIGNATQTIYPGKWGYINPLNNWSGMIDLPTDLVHQGDNVIFGTGRFGGTSNYTEFEADGTLKMVGDATTWDDIRIVPSIFDVAGGTDPDINSYQPGGAGTTFLVYAFAKGDSGYFTIQIPHDYKAGSTLKAHVHWTPGARGVAENGNTVQWRLDYSFIAINGTFPASSTIAMPDVCDGVDHKHQMTAEVDISGAGITASSKMIGRIYRWNDASDTWAGTLANLPVFIEFDMHYEKASLGTKTST